VEKGRKYASIQLFSLVSHGGTGLGNGIQIINNTYIIFSNGFTPVFAMET
jgi:hypothetical protein